MGFAIHHLARGIPFHYRWEGPLLDTSAYYYSQTKLGAELVSRKNINQGNQRINAEIKFLF